MFVAVVSGWGGGGCPGCVAAVVPAAAAPGVGVEAALPVGAAEPVGGVAALRGGGSGVGTSHREFLQVMALKGENRPPRPAFARFCRGFHGPVFITKKPCFVNRGEGGQGNIK